MWRFLLLLVIVGILLLSACTLTRPREPSQRISLRDERGHYTFDTQETTWDVFLLGGDQAIFESRVARWKARSLEIAVISSGGQFAILKAQTGVSDPLRLVDWQSSPAIFKGDEPNDIQAICGGDYLSFSANDSFLVATHDSGFSSGELGVVLGAVEETLWVSFDDILVRDAAQVGG